MVEVNDGFRFRSAPVPESPRLAAYKRLREVCAIEISVSEDLRSFDPKEGQLLKLQEDDKVILYNDFDWMTPSIVIKKIEIENVGDEFIITPYCEDVQGENWIEVKPYSEVTRVKMGAVEPPYPREEHRLTTPQMDDLATAIQRTG